MKIFNRNGKMNFVDDNNVLVGFDYEECCCESFGWEIANPNDTQIKYNEDSDYSGYVFDPAFCNELTGEEYDEGGAVEFRLVKGDQELLLRLWNSHNGYYGHGFEMGEIGGKSIHSGCL